MCRARNVHLEMLNTVTSGDTDVCVSCAIEFTTVPHCSPNNDEEHAVLSYYNNNTREA